MDIFGLIFFVALLPIGYQIGMIGVAKGLGFKPVVVEKTTGKNGRMLRSFEP